ncbi:MAG: dimethyl sulfoxide reductase anchor subunit family protein [Alphaproteobacteria bacterium]
MRPAYSIIFFTAASGAGYGLLFALALVAVFGTPPGDTWFGVSGFALALALVTAGLAASAFHLGRPERALKAFSQWRSSWLSREGVAAAATYPVGGAFALAWLLDRSGALLVVPALATAAMCIVTVACTGLIYATLKPIRRWNNGWVVPGYLALALMTGALWLDALAHTFGVTRPEFASLAAAAVVVAGLLKLGYWRFIDSDTGGPTAGSATGLGALGAVRLLDAPHTSENYLLKEMGYRIARKHARRLRRVALWGGFALPLLLTFVAGLFAPASFATLCALLAAALASAGVLVERWLFFAEARHSITLYYGAHAA